MNVKLDGTVPQQPYIHNQLITSLEIFARREVIVLEEVEHRNDVLLVPFSTQLETGILLHCILVNLLILISK